MPGFRQLSYSSAHILQCLVSDSRAIPLLISYNAWFQAVELFLYSYRTMPGFRQLIYSSAHIVQCLVSDNSRAIPLLISYNAWFQTVELFLCSYLTMPGFRHSISQGDQGDRSGSMEANGSAIFLEVEGQHETWIHAVAKFCRSSSLSSSSS
ncbi:hypothetical protein RRG08_041173 [Elysia crispata]|uniref:Uncharacterized protein n=1 Tax=Elysia crispata TaxID=231223 RepID=A0AAE0XYV0_9GAST|nr:hypothetical protein RRG08_041173 [Elysia crispata]